MKNKLFEAIGVAFGGDSYDKKEISNPPAPGCIVINIVSVKGMAFCSGESRDIASDKFSGPIIHYALGLRAMILK